MAYELNIVTLSPQSSAGPSRRPLSHQDIDQPLHLFRDQYLHSLNIHYPNKILKSDVGMHNIAVNVAICGLKAPARRIAHTEKRLHWYQ